MSAINTPRQSDVPTPYEQYSALRETHPELDTLNHLPDFQYRVNDTQTIMYPQWHNGKLREYLDNVVRIQEIYKRCCALFGVTMGPHPCMPLNVIPEEKIRIDTTIQANGWHLVEADPTQGDLYRIKEPRSLHLQGLTIGEPLLRRSMESQVELESLQVTLAHEFGHMLLNFAPEEAQEWLAGYCALLYSQVYGVQSIGDCSAFWSVGDDTKGTHIGSATLATSTLYNHYTALIASGADAIRTSLGSTPEQELSNARILARHTHLDYGKMPPHQHGNSGFIQQPTREKWLHKLRKINQNRPGVRPFNHALMAHPALKKADGDTTYVAPFVSGNGCTIGRYDIKLNPNYGLARVPHNKKPVVSDFDRTVMEYEDKDIRCTVITDEGEELQMRTRNGDRVCVDGSFLAAYLSHKGGRSSFQNFFIEFSTTSGEMQYFGPFSREAFGGVPRKKQVEHRVLSGRTTTTHEMMGVIMEAREAL